MHISIMSFMVFCGILAETIGRKFTILSGQACILIGWVIVYFALNFYMLLIGRLIMGLGVGLSHATTTLQVSQWVRKFKKIPGKKLVKFWQF